MSLRRVLAVAVALGTPACQSADVMATDGRVIHQPSWGEPEATILASGAHDLACPADRLTTRSLTKDLRAAEGCGQRAIYVFSRNPDGFPAFVLIGKVPLELPPPGSAGR